MYILKLPKEPYSSAWKVCYLQKHILMMKQ